MFIRRIYYNKLSGEVLYHYSQNVLPEGIEPEKLSIEECLPNENPEEIEIMEWTKIDEDIETKFNEGCKISVDISTIPHQLIFINPLDSIPEDERPVTTDDCITAFEELGVIKKEDLNE